MPRKETGHKVDRRRFLTGVAVAGAIAPQAVGAATSTAPVDAAKPARPSALPPTERVAVAETGGVPDIRPYSEHGRPGSDFMVDVIKTLDIKYLPANPASSFRAIHELLINYGGNKMPEFLTCMHEEFAVGMAHGYFKVAGKPLMTLCHGTVGLQHAAMGIYNAFCDRVPVIVVGGTDLDAAYRPPGVPTVHSAQDINALVRDFTKWDDTPVSAATFRAVIRPRLQDRNHAALCAGHDCARWRPAAGTDQRSRAEALHPALCEGRAAARRDRSGARSCAACWSTPSAR